MLETILVFCQEPAQPAKKRPRGAAAACHRAERPCIERDPCVPNRKSRFARDGGACIHDRSKTSLIASHAYIEDVILRTRKDHESSELWWWSRRHCHACTGPNDTTLVIVRSSGQARWQRRRALQLIPAPPRRVRRRARHRALLRAALRGRPLHRALHPVMRRLQPGAGLLRRPPRRRLLGGCHPHHPRRERCGWHPARRHLHRAPPCGRSNRPHAWIGRWPSRRSLPSASSCHRSVHMEVQRSRLLRGGRGLCR